MKNLLESIFDDDLTAKELDIIDDWCDTFIRDPFYKYGNYKIDYHLKTVIMQSTWWSKLDIDASNSEFNGFPPKWNFINLKGEQIKEISLKGNIKGLRNLPSYIESIYIRPNPKTKTVEPQVLKDISSSSKKYKMISFLYADNVKFNKLDLSDLNVTITNSLQVSGFENGATVKFNPNLKTNILQFGYYSVGNGYNDVNIDVENLPIFKTISFKAGDFDHVKAMIDGISDFGKSNFNSIVVNGSELSKEEKEAVKNILKKEESEFVSSGEILKKIAAINSVKNDKDGTKDRFGCPLNYGDVVLVCESSIPSYPSFLDVYKGCSQNGRIRTDKQKMVPPRNVIKLNNPKILELLK